MFLNRLEAGHRLARRLRKRSLFNPLVLAIPRGGVPVGAALADALHADLDVILARKLRAPGMPEVAIGAIGEDGSIHLDPDLKEWLSHLPDYLSREIRLQKDEIIRRQKLLRRNRPAESVCGRSVILTDDGIATGSTMTAALKVLAGKRPHEIIVAVPVASCERVASVRALCDEFITLLAPVDLWSIAQFYKDFRQVEDEEAIGLLHSRWETQHAVPARG